jgi:hypothetical protein
MNPPFTASQFLDVIRQYNAAAWPAQVIFYGVAALMIYRAARTSHNADRWVSGLLAFLWAWMGVVYHWLFFTSINPAAWIFGALFVAQALVFLAAGTLGTRLRFRFTGGVYGWTGTVFLGYALVVYPVLSALAGHPYPAGPTFGLPCPTTIFTIGLLLWASRPVPLWVLAVPLAWSLLGASAAIQFGILEDYGLVVAGVLGTIMIIARNRRFSEVDAPDLIPA